MRVYTGILFAIKYLIETNKSTYMKKLLIIILSTSILFFSCGKEKDDSTDQINTSMKDLVVSNDFNWSTGIKGNLTVSFDNPNNVSLEYEYISIINQNGDKLYTTQVKNGQANFNITLPNDGEFYLFYPITGDTKKISSDGEMQMILGNTLPPGMKSTTSISEVESCTTCENPMENGGAENPVINVNWTSKNENDVPGWLTTASDNRIEIWTSGFQGVIAQEGIQFMEINANMVAALYQELCLEPGSTVKWSVWHRGRKGVDVAEVKIGATVETAEYLATMTDGNTEWGYYTGNYTVPEGQETTVFVFESVSAAGGSQSVGNFIDNFEIECDFDGDGTPDDSDDSGDDSDVSYTSYFPSSGKQVLAFEDLWPSLGDFDFNDVVLSNQATILKNANQELVSASFKVSIDAIGAGLDNGIGMMIYDENGDPIAENVISELSGNATLDADNPNGIILTDDVFATTNDRYQNNGIGATTDSPDTLYFTITFNAGITGFTPELYIFRSIERSHEVHRSVFPGTAIMNQSLFNTDDDNGNFKTVNNLPWGMEIITDGHFKVPVERIEIINAYPEFEVWATSGGAQNDTWYISPDETKVVDIFAK
ncbi:MAG: hypothetical protein C0598_08275 [Marinilabiliales bacterium]|nr:MAG: hypothetical protein C0598_08275 [Marinilabiliales bacterium]